MRLKKLLDYQLSSGGSVNVNIEQIREYIVNRISIEESHQQICRAFETLTGYGTKSTDDPSVKEVTPR